MATENTKILTAEQEQQLRQPIDEYVGGIQAKIDALRKDGTDQVVEIQSSMDSLKRDRIYTCDPCNYRIRYYGLDSVVDENTGDDNGDNGDNGDNAEPQGAKFPPLKPAAQ